MTLQDNTAAVKFLVCNISIYIYIKYYVLIIYILCTI